MTTATPPPAPTADQPRYGVLVAKRHLTPTATLAQKRQLALLALKLVRAALPAGSCLEARRDVAVLRRWLDLLNAADRVARLRAGTWRTPGVSPAAAATIAIDRAAVAAWLAGAIPAGTTQGRRR